MIWVAYNASGDLIATAFSEANLWLKVSAAGYSEDEVIVGRTAA